MKILLLGKDGQVGRELANTLSALGTVTATGRADLDLRQTSRVADKVRDENPDVIVNAAAYTAVDRAESEPEIAHLVNAAAPSAMAAEAARLGALLVHFSTDYVFDGTQVSPYRETDAPNPVNVYGTSKLAGEEAIRHAGCRHLILRTSWVYSDAGSNFLLTMLRLAKQGRPLRVVDDQVGAPTSAPMIAVAVPGAIRLAAGNPSLCGTYHLSAAGRTTWYGFAKALLKESGLDAEIAAIRSEDYGAPAKRPRNSLLDNSKVARLLGIRLPAWEQGMVAVLQRLRSVRR